MVQVKLSLNCQTVSEERVLDTAPVILCPLDNCANRAGLKANGNSNDCLNKL